ncbi:MAG: MerR family transcriptional regulator [Anaerotardibacter sp.]
MKIGEFSKLSQITIKALRYYEKEGLLVPDSVDPMTGYRSYSTNQLIQAAHIKSFRQLGFSIEEIKQVLSGEDFQSALSHKAKELEREQNDISFRLSLINHLLKEENMNYQVTQKHIPAHIVYYAETVLDSYADAMTWIPKVGAEAKEHNPNLKCAEPSYEYIEYLDCEYRESNVKVRFSEAVVDFGVESENIKFKEVPEATVLSIYHRGPYERLGEAYAFIYKYVEDNGFEVAGYSRESYIDGIWNKSSAEDWLTEIQLPIK